MLAKNNIRHGAYHVTRGGHLAFVHKTTGEYPPVEGWVWLPRAGQWYQFLWTIKGVYFHTGTSQWDIVGRWEGEMPAKFPMKRRRSRYVI